MLEYLVEQKTEPNCYLVRRERDYLVGIGWVVADYWVYLWRNWVKLHYHMHLLRLVLQIFLLFFQEFLLDNSEIQSVINMFPMIEHTSADKMAQNCKLVVEYGYPRTELSFLVLSNPGFLVYDKDSLKQVLINLTKDDADLEELLNQNPYLL